VIVVAVRWYLRYGLSYRDVEELLAERGIYVDHVTRVRPGFWDNNGRYCGTAGVLALACDRHVEQTGSLDFAGVLVDDLITHATVDSNRRLARQDA
jgi:hypothetical protein